MAAVAAAAPQLAGAAAPQTDQAGWGAAAAAAAAIRAGFFPGAGALPGRIHFSQSLLGILPGSTGRASRKPSRKQPVFVFTILLNIKYANPYSKT